MRRELTSRYRPVKFRSLRRLSFRTPGLGMTEDEVRNAILDRGADRRKSEGSEQTGLKAPGHGQKGHREILGVWHRK